MTIADTAKAVVSKVTALFKKDGQEDGDAELCREMNGLVEECQSVWGQTVDGRTIEEGWDIGGRGYLGDQWDAVKGGTSRTQEGGKLRTGSRTGRAGVEQFTINLTGNVIVSDVATQTEQGVRNVIGSRESSGEVPYFVSPKGAKRLQKSAAEGTVLYEGFTPEQLAGFATIDEDQADALRTGGLPPEDLIPINDATRAEICQNAYDGLWERSQSDQKVFENTLYKSIYGHQPVVLDWDDENHIYRLINVPVRNFYSDPTAVWVSDADWVIWDYPMDAERAKAKWTDLADKFEKAKREGRFDDGEASGTKRGSAVYGTTDFRRGMVTIRTMWRRHQQYPMTLDEAMKCEVVCEVDAVTDPLTGAMQPYNGPKHAMEHGAEFTGEMHDDTTSQPLGKTLCLCDEFGKPTGEATSEGGENWPTVSGIRQVQIIKELDAKIADVRCPYPDIPAAWNINIPIPHRPFGIGESMRLDDLQRFINKLASVLYNLLRYYQYPPEFWPKSLLKDLQDKGIATNHVPGRQVGVEDQKWVQFFANGTRQGFAQFPPPIPAMYMQLYLQARTEFDKLSGNSDVRQGSVPSGVTASAAIEQLRTESHGITSFKAKHTEWWLLHMFKLILCRMKTSLPERVWAAYNRKYPIQVIRECLKGLDVEMFDLELEIASGRGSLRREKMAKAEAARARKDLSFKTYHQIAEIVADPELERAQLVKEAAEDAAILAGARLNQGAISATGPKATATAPVPGDPTTPNPDAPNPVEPNPLAAPPAA